MYIMAAYRHNLGHLVLSDVPISVNVVHTERPVQLLVQVLTTGHEQTHCELLEVHAPVPVRVERAKHVLCKLFGIATEQFVVDLNEVLARELGFPRGQRILVVIVPDLDFLV